MRGVWVVDDAVNEHKEYNIEYPSNLDLQKSIADCFGTVIRIDFQNCVGWMDSLLTWIMKPSWEGVNKANVGSWEEKISMGGKNKFSLNCQAVFDGWGKFLDVSITNCGALSGCPAFESSNVYKGLMVKKECFEKWIYIVFQ